MLIKQPCDLYIKYNPRACIGCLIFQSSILLQDTAMRFTENLVMKSIDEMNKIDMNALVFHPAALKHCDKINL